VADAAVRVTAGAVCQPGERRGRAGDRGSASGDGRGAAAGDRGRPPGHWRRAKRHAPAATTSADNAAAYLGRRPVVRNSLSQPGTLADVAEERGPTTTRRFRGTAHWRRRRRRTAHAGWRRWRRRRRRWHCGRVRSPEPASVERLAMGAAGLWMLEPHRRCSVRGCCRDCVERRWLLWGVAKIVRSRRQRVDAG
jgi:hypothetical protein